MANSLCKRSNCKTLQTRLYKGIPALKNRQEQKADHLSVRAGDKVQMIYFQETIWLNYTCSARSDTGNVATVSITRDTDTESYRTASKYRMASPLTSSVHAAFSRVIAPSGSLWSPRKLNLAHVSRSSSPVQHVNLTAINDLKQKQVDGKTRPSLAPEQLPANHSGPGLSVSEDTAGPVGQPERVSNERLPDCFAFTLTDSLTITPTPRGPSGPGQRHRHKAVRC